MKISTTTGLVGFLLTLSTLSALPAQSTGNLSSSSSTSPNLEKRLNRLTDALRNREQQLETNSLSSALDYPQDLAQFRNSFRNGGNFRNTGRWRNGWRDGGGFVNFRKR